MNVCTNYERPWFAECPPTRGLDRLIDLLEKGSPLLIHGSFTRARADGLFGHAYRLEPSGDRASDDGCGHLLAAPSRRTESRHQPGHPRVGSVREFRLRACAPQLLVEMKEHRATRRQQPETTSPNRVKDLVTV